MKTAVEPDARRTILDPGSGMSPPLVNVRFSRDAPSCFSLAATAGVENCMYTATAAPTPRSPATARSIVRVGRE